MKCLKSLSSIFFVALTIQPLAHVQADEPAPTTRPKPVTVTLDMSPDAEDMAHLIKSEMGYMPATALLVEQRPAAITKEPTYQGKPLYGAFQIGNGPRSVTYFAVDEAEGKDGKIYVDLNQNGDLTDDGPGKWEESKKNDDGITNYRSNISVHASWGSPVKETESASYSLMIYKQQGATRVGYVKTSARAGSLKLGDKTYSIVLAENTNDGIFTVPAFGDRTRRPVALLVDIDGDGSFKGAKTVKDGKTYYSSEQFFLNQPFKLDDQWWLARPSISGSELTLVPTVAPGAQAESQEPKEAKELLAAGTAAPDFTAQTPDGKPIHLSDFKGKVVILDFWATWCGPCQASMPGLQKLYDQVRDQGVVVLSVNVFDEKDPFDAWITKHSGKTYNFTFARDPAGHDDKTSIAASKFGVSGIPTMYLIGRDGKIAAAIVGSGNEKTLVSALNTQGIKAVADAK